MTSTTSRNRQVIADAPAKIVQFLQKAADRGLTVSKTLDADNTWAISSPNPIDDSQLWLYFTPGARGGSLRIVRYDVNLTHRKPRKLTRQTAAFWIDEMGDALDRHHARQAAQADVRPLDTGRQHSAATVAKVTRTPRTPATDTLADKAAHIRATDPPLPVAAAAELAVTGLRANGRFALRVARHGHIQRNTPTKVRAALINRGLIQAAGGVLTDLGRAARQHLVGA